MKQKVKEVQEGAEGISPEGTPHFQVASLDKKRDGDGTVAFGCMRKTW